MKEIKLYTDGACSGNPGPGGWGAVLLYGAHEKELFGSEAETTNNRMELTGAIRGLEALKEPCMVDLYTDSAYLCNAINREWLTHWQQNGWLTAAKKPVENQDLWIQLVKLLQRHTVTFHKVKGHANNELNNRCDKLARDAVKSLQSTE
jgi:ribonuclease HI